MASRTTERWKLALILLVLALGLGAVAVFALTPRPGRFEAVPGRPLLQQDGKQFADAQVGLRFDPPAEWGMQVRSTEAPKHRPDRLLVKYKRVTGDSPPAWLRVRVVDVPAEQSPGQFLSTRKPPEADWKPRREIEEGLIVAGQPAARSTFGGPYDADGRGAKDYTCVIVAVRRGDCMFEFAGSYDTTDLQAPEQLKSALDSVAFDR